MFKSARWRSEKNRIKTVFKLQFDATQVFQPGVEALGLSLIPVDVGKPSVRLERAKVQDGNCRWENPVYEAVKFIQDTRTGKITDKYYHFVVSTGSTKTGFFGEVFVNFAEYADATKASSVSLPLKSSQNSPVLHVSIQRLQENADQREVGDCEGARKAFHDRSLKMYLSNTDESNQTSSTENASSRAMKHNVGLSVDSRTSSGSEMTLSSSESSFGLDFRQETSLRNSSISPDPNRSLSSFGLYLEAHKSSPNTQMPLHGERLKSRSDSSAGSDHVLSLHDSTIGFHDGLKMERLELASDANIEKLKGEMEILLRQLDFSELELQTLRKQIVKENKRGQDLLKEVAALKEERDARRSECERLRSFQKRLDEAKERNKAQFENLDLRTVLEETKEELIYEKELNSNLRVQLQKTQESNSELMLAVQDLDEMLEQKNKEIMNLSSNRLRSEDGAPDLRSSETDDDEEQKALEKLVKQHSNVKEAYLLEQKIVDLYGEIEIYRREKDELELQMEQLALDHEILKQENHDISCKLKQTALQEQLKMQYECPSPPTAANDLESRIQVLENELSRKSEEFSDSLVTIKELKAHINALEEELKRQAQGFEADLEFVTHLKVEHEQRAIRVEEVLRQTRLKNASTAEKLQEEFRRLSVQMASTFDANEKLAMNAMTEANELRAEKNQLEEMLQQANHELRSVSSDYEGKLQELSSQIDVKTRQIEDMLLEMEDTSKQLESVQEQEKEVHERLSEDIQRLKAENQRLEEEIVCISEKAEQKENLKVELESMRNSVGEAGALMQRASAQRNELVIAIALFKKETDKSLEELNETNHLKVEKERMIKLLSSELENLNAQCSDLKNSLFEYDVEKEKLRKQLVQLKSDLKKKDNAFASIEKMLKDKNGRIAVTAETKSSPRNKKSLPNGQGPKEPSSSLKEKIKMLEDMIKMKGASLETSTASFLEKEKVLLRRIEELEDTVGNLNRGSPLRKVFEDDGTLTSNDCVKEDTVSLDMRSDDNLRQPNGSTAKAEEGMNSHGSNLATELVSLKERNQLMESELKDMQERYSEISLKFAEVEGERQKLVMTVRNLKNAKKG